jgi:hypothetical protein
LTTALILGGAECVWDDVEAALDLGEFDAVVACNDVAAVWPGPLAALVTLHPEKAGLWLKRRAQAGYEPPAAVYGHVIPRRPHRDPNVTHAVDPYFPGQTLSGSSGLFAAKVALVDLGHDRGVLCGVPMLMKAGHIVRGKPWSGANSHQQGWKQVMPALKGRLTSMSGWTAQHLGRPDADWFTS